MTYVVTGGAGFIGSHLVDRLLDDGHAVIVIDDFSLGKEENLFHHASNKKLTVVRRSVVEDVSDIFKATTVDGVFHMAAISSVQYTIENPTSTHHANVNGTFNILNACVAYGVKRFVLASTCAIYGEQETLPLRESMSPQPLSPYALHKLIGEEYGKLFFRIYGLATVHLRYFNVFGPRLDPEGDYARLIAKFTRLLQKNTVPTIYGDGTHTRDYIFVSDIVEANIAAMETQNEDAFGETFNIASGNHMTVNEVTSALLRVSGSELDPVHGEPVVEPAHMQADITKAKKILGWEPSASFEDALRDTYAFFIDKNVT